MPIFVAGTGRSGTSQLAEVIGEHPQVWHVPIETRFLVDPGGFEELSHRLGGDWYTPFSALRAIEQLEYMLRWRAERSEANPESPFDIARAVGRERYWAWVDRLTNDLIWYEFGQDWPMPEDLNPPRLHPRVGRFFPDRSELIALLRTYVDELFGGAAADHGKSIWCEKTPYNLLSMRFLWELFPEAHIVHIMRNPIAVAASHRSQDWSPNNLEDVCNWLEPLYRRWLNFKETYDFPATFIEVKLEDLATDWPGERAKLFARLELPDVETSRTFSSDRVVHSQGLDRDEEGLVRKRLGFAIEGLGYS